MTVIVCPPAIGVAAPELPSIRNYGHSQASLECRDGTCHIPKDSKYFPRDQSGRRTSVKCGGSVPLYRPQFGNQNIICSSPACPCKCAGRPGGRWVFQNSLSQSNWRWTWSIDVDSPRWHKPYSSGEPAGEEKCLDDAAHCGGVQYAWRSTKH